MDLGLELFTAFRFRLSGLFMWGLGGLESTLRHPAVIKRFNTQTTGPQTQPKP